MASSGRVFYRERHPAPWRTHGVFLVGVVGVIGLIIAGGTGPLRLLLGVPLAVLWLLFSVIRITLSEKRLDIAHGFRRLVIPLLAIEGSEVVAYNWMRGWRPPPLRPGEVTRPSLGGKAVRITWRDAQGDRHGTMVQSRHAEGLLSELRLACELSKVHSGRRFAGSNEICHQHLGEFDETV